MWIFLDYWKEWAVGVLVIVLLYVGYHYHTLEDYKIKYYAAEVQLEAQAAQNKATFELALKYQTENTKLKQAANKRQEQGMKYVSQSKVYSTCINTPDVLKLLQQKSSGN